MNIISRIKGIFLSKLYLAKHPLYTLTFCSLFLFGNMRMKASFFTDDEISAALKEGKSIIRLGDGDIVNIQLGMENCYHRDDENLLRMYREIIAEYSTTSPYILSVPKFVSYTNKELSALGKGKLNWGNRMRSMYFLRFNKNCRYMDAHNFYYDDYFTNRVAPILNNKKIICITNKRTIEKQRANQAIPWKNIVYIESPEVNAMDAYENILSVLDKELGGDKENTVILAAMGPVGKYIVFQYAKMGYQGIDIGKVVEVMFTGESIQYMI